MQFKVGDVEISIDTYSGNNATKIKTGDKTLYFSYETPIAIFDGEHGFINGKEYGKTTEQHKKVAKFDICDEQDIMPKEVEVLESDKFHEIVEFDEPKDYKTKRAGDRE